LKNSKIISKLARYFSIVSFVFVIFSAIITFYLLQIGSPTAPIEYVVFVILSSVVPYLFIAVLSLVIAFIAGSTGIESPEKEALPPVQPETVNA
jgi:magnesium-transporting ATPase (P-type)